MADRIFNRAEFEADAQRARSPEWDYGVHWVRQEGEQFPRYRVSWIVETGELYAVASGGPRSTEVIVLGVVPKVGEYPYPSDGGDLDAWAHFKREQTIENVMDGWAEGDFTKPLDWIRQRVPREEG